MYAAQKCQVCHSVGGVGNKKGALDDVGARLKADDIRQWIVAAPEMTAKTNSMRKPPMKSYTLPKDDLDVLVNALDCMMGISASIFKWVDGGWFFMTPDTTRSM